MTEVPETSTYEVFCNCGCGEVVALSFPGGFNGTTCELGACVSRRRMGMVTLVLKRSAGLGFTSAFSTSVRHADGLVTFSGSAGL